MQGRSAEEYRAPLFIAWQLTNRCTARCLACCEESGPDNAWADELTRDEALRLVREINGLGIPYVAFGGGEPLGVSHCWELLDELTAAGADIKLETDGRHIDDAAAKRLARMRVHVQISVDGATAATHERVRPGSSFASATGALRSLIAHGAAPHWVFVPTRLNIHEIVDAFDCACELGCGVFVTGPMMRIGRAARDWQRLACTADEWERAADGLRERAAATGASTALSIYPWDILGELERRLESPQAMLLIVPNGKVKLLNALPFSPADLRRVSLSEAWRAYCDAWTSDEVRDFISRCRSEPALLLHANETWAMGAGSTHAPVNAITFSPRSPA